MEHTVRMLWLSCGVAAVVLVAMAIGFLGSCDQWHHDHDQELRRELAELEQLARKRAQIVEELIAGQRSLFEAAAGFRELSEASSDDLLRYLRMFHPGRTDEELYYLHVLMHVEANFRWKGTDVTIVEILRQEFDARRRSGTLTVDYAGEYSVPPTAGPP
jgi:hypothetical protein